MKKSQVQIGDSYVAKVSGILAVVWIAHENPHGGWNAVNVATGRVVRIRTAARLREAVKDTERIGFPPRYEDDDRETVAEGDKWMNKPLGARDQ